MLPGSLVDIFEFETKNEQVMMDGGEPASAQRILLGITKASLATNLVPFSGILPGNNKGIDGRGNQRKSGPACGTKGKYHNRKAYTRGYRHQKIQRHNHQHRIRDARRR